MTIEAPVPRLVLALLNGLAGDGGAAGWRPWFLLARSWLATSHRHHTA